MLDETTRYKLLKMLEAHPGLSQRQLAHELGISVGKVNYCLNALIGKGMLKVNNFRNNKNKLAYMYLLTPSGIEEKARITIQYLKIKMQEYEELRGEIEELQRETSESSSRKSSEI